MTPVRISFPLTIYDYMYVYFPYMSSSYVAKIVLTLNSFYSFLVTVRAYVSSPVTSTACGDTKLNNISSFLTYTLLLIIILPFTPCSHKPIY